MLKKVVFISLLLILAVAVYGQGKITLKEEKASDLIPQWGSSYQFGYLFKVDDGEYQGIGRKGERLEDLLKTDEAAYKEFKKFKRKIVIGKAGYIVGLISVPSLYLVVQDDDEERERNAKAITAVGIAAIGTTVYIITHFTTTKHLVDAVNIYNQNLNKE